ncbi:hypothetical protein ACLOJK_038826 [Asimina triloba]
MKESESDSGAAGRELELEREASQPSGAGRFGKDGGDCVAPWEFGESETVRCFPELQLYPRFLPLITRKRKKTSLVSRPFYMT